jgi:hypothetical protein
VPAFHEIEEVDHQGQDQAAGKKKLTADESQEENRKVVKSADAAGEIQIQMIQVMQDGVSIAGVLGEGHILRHGLAEFAADMAAQPASAKAPRTGIEKWVAHLPGGENRKSDPVGGPQNG